LGKIFCGCYNALLNSLTVYEICADGVGLLEMELHLALDEHSML
jgi:hypothetical protein